MENFIEKVRFGVSRMINPGDKVLVAVSGGADSVALLHILKFFREEFKFELSIAHLNHMARGSESEADAHFVSRLGRECSIDTIIENIDVAKEQSKLKTSFQEAARILRYRFLESTLEKVGGNKIALGHTADDQVETLLMNLLRGSGLRGLAGIAEVRGHIIRPLFSCFRNEVETYIKSHELKFRSDSSNSKAYYLRNRVRLELVPVLESYNPNFKSKLIETAGLLRDDETLLTSFVEDIMKAMAQPVKDGDGLELDIHQLNDFSTALKRRLIRQSIQNVQGNLRRISTKHIRELIHLMDRPETGKQMHLPGGLTVVLGQGSVEIRRIHQPSSRIVNKGLSSVKPTELKVPGCTEVVSMGIRFNAKLLPGSSQYQPKHPHEAFLDLDKTGEGIQARFFKEGDRFIPLGMKGRKKLKSFFIDEKIPRKTRKSIPILTTRADDIIWIFGRRIAEPYRVTPKTCNILFIEGIKV